MAENPDDAGFLEHLEALRRVLLKILLLFMIGCVPGWYFSDPLLKLLLKYITAPLLKATLSPLFRDC